MQSVMQLASLAARQALEAQSLLSSNLANADSTAFKADLYEAQSTLDQSSYRDAMARFATAKARIDLTPGNIAQTGHELDIAIAGEGWMEVINPAGELVLSRRGDLRVDPAGLLVDGEGNQLMGEGGPIALPPYSSLTIGSDGTVSIVPLGEPPTASAAIDRLMLVNPPPEDLYKGVDGQLRHPEIGALDPAANVRLAVGALEQSNVNPIEIMVEMIELSREFEGHIKAMKQVDDMNASSASLMKLE